MHGPLVAHSQMLVKETSQSQFVKGFDNEVDRPVLDALHQFVFLIDSTNHHHAGVGVGRDQTLECCDTVQLGHHDSQRHQSFMRV